MSSPHQTNEQHRHLQNHQSPSSDDSKRTTISDSQTNLTASQVPLPLPPQASTDNISPAETHQFTAGRRSQSTPPIIILDRYSITSNPRQASPLGHIHDPRTSSSSSNTLGESSENRQGRPLVDRHHPRSTSLQPLRTVLTPNTRQTSLSREDSQSRSVTMSSGSAPSNTSSSAAQLPYAPFPYPAPANAGQSGGKGNGK